MVTRQAELLLATAEVTVELAELEGVLLVQLAVEVELVDTLEAVGEAAMLVQELVLTEQVAAVAVVELVGQ
jgi:hypothetical protein